MELKDILHLYIGQKVKFHKSNYMLSHVNCIGSGDVKTLTIPFLHTANMNKDCFKLILRPLSSMSEEECLFLSWLNLHHWSLKEDDVTIEEIDISVNTNDGGLQVDADAALVIEVSCRCFDGQLCIRRNCNIELWNDDGNQVIGSEQAASFVYLLSKGFDIFNLHEKGLCIYES